MIQAPRALQAAHNAPAAPRTVPKQPPVGRARDPEFELKLGVRIRACRMAARLSQTDLGQCVGISFQQMQKYEKGRNRIAVSTLQAFAAALGVHPGSFFDDMPVPSGDIPDVKATMRLAERIQRVRDPAVMKRLMALVDALAMVEEDDDGEDRAAPIAVGDEPPPPASRAETPERSRRGDRPVARQTSGAVEALVARAGRRRGR